ncbi:hypothetical protein [Nonomuraea recticatena]|uniref:hypothetical protein n=1 Tax=Nonomuraea recticatena TaxID=46178 RepID=UPI0036203EF3
MSRRQPVLVGATTARSAGRGPRGEKAARRGREAPGGRPTAGAAGRWRCLAYREEVTAGSRR